MDNGDTNHDTQLDPTPSPSPTAEHQQTAHKKSMMMSWIMLVVGLIVGAGLVGVIWLYWPKAPATTTSVTPSTQTSPATVAATTSCKLDSLSMAVGKTDGAAGTLYQHMVLTNKGTASCTLAGHPAVFLLDASNNVLGDGAVPMMTPAATTLTLAAGAKAYTAVAFPQAANFTAGECTANAVTLRVYIPGTASYLEAALAKPHCPGFSATAFATGE